MILTMFRDAPAAPPSFNFAPVWKAIRTAVWEIEARQNLAEYEVAFEAERRHARDYIPDVQVMKYPGGRFLCYQEHEIPLVAIVDITVYSSIQPPRLNHQYPLDTLPELDAAELAAAKAFREFRFGLSEDYEKIKSKVPKKTVAACGQAHGTITVHLLSKRQIDIQCSGFEADILCARMIDAWKRGE